MFTLCSVLTLFFGIPHGFGSRQQYRRVSGYLITAPVPFFATYIAGIGVSTAWALIAAGEIETIAVGRRRLVVIESWRNYVARKLAAPPEDARRNNRVRPSARLRSCEQALTGRRGSARNTA
jgi:hypothetical protein